jgi:hypothetical protein
MLKSYLTQEGGPVGCPAVVVLGVESMAESMECQARIWPQDYL